MMKTAVTKSCGFTLLELLVVVVILLLVYALLPTVYANLVPSRQYEAVSRQLELELRAARTRAMVTSKTVILEFGNEGRSYSSDAAGKGELLPNGFAIRLEDDIDGQVKFYPDGSNDGFRLNLRNELQSTWLISDWVSGQIVRE